MADFYKIRGNNNFKKGLYAEAINDYSQAISNNPTEAVYYTNRAICHSKLRQFRPAMEDCERAIRCNSKSIKGFYLLGQCQMELIDAGECHNITMKDVLANLSVAYRLAISEHSSFIDEIANLIRQAKKKQWEIRGMPLFAISNSFKLMHS